MQLLPSKVRRRAELDPDLIKTSAWPTVDEQSIEDPDKRELYRRRSDAITLYFDGYSGREIEKETRISIREVNRLKERCLQPHPDGRIWGFRALVHGIRLKSYQRKSAVRLSSAVSYGGAGAFGLLLETYPTVKDLIDRHVVKRRKRGAIYESRVRIQSLFSRMLNELRKLGVEVRNEYPFTTKNLGYVSLAKYVHKLIVKNPNKAIPANYGDNANKKNKTSDGSKRPVVRPYQRVECDAHKIDAIFCILIPSIFGNLIPHVVKRLWVIVIKEIISRAVLGYHLSLNRECRLDDVLQAIKNSLTVWQPRELIVPGMEYRGDAGFPSSYHSRFVGACWDEFSVDGALAHKSPRLEAKLKRVVGAEPLLLDRGPDDRPFIESFFKQLEEQGFHRLPNTTGGGPWDSIRNKPDLAACRFFIQIEHLEDLIDVMLANYNARQHSSIGHRSPLKYLDFLTQDPRNAPRQADPDEVRWLRCLYKRVRVRGGLEQGRRPFVHFEGVNYSSDVLRKHYALCGKTISIEADPDDPRLIRAFAPDATEIGLLQAAPPWNLTPHTINMRKAVNALAQDRLIDLAKTKDPVIALLDYCESIILDGKAVPPVYLEARRLLAERIEELREPGAPVAPTRISTPSKEASGTTESRREIAASQRRPLPPLRKAING